MIAAGALAGDWLPSVGLDLAAPLCRIAMVGPRLRDRRHRWAAIAAATTVTLAAGWPAGTGVAAAIVVGAVAARLSGTDVAMTTWLAIVAVGRQLFSAPCPCSSSAAWPGPRGSTRSSLRPAPRPRPPWPPPGCSGGDDGHRHRRHGRRCWPRAVAVGRAHGPRSARRLARLRLGVRCRRAGGLTWRPGGRPRTFPGPWRSKPAQGRPREGHQGTLPADGITFGLGEGEPPCLRPHPCFPPLLAVASASTSAASASRARPHDPPRRHPRHRTRRAGRRHRCQRCGQVDAARGHRRRRRPEHRQRALRRARGRGPSEPDGSTWSATSRRPTSSTATYRSAATLRYAARLRLPHGSPADELDRAVDDTIAQLGLHASRRRPRRSISAAASANGPASPSSC